jgi:hypothetical protein
MRHGERFCLRYLKYVRPSPPPVVSPIMRQFRKATAGVGAVLPGEWCEASHLDETTW